MPPNIYLQKTGEHFESVAQKAAQHPIAKLGNASQDAPPTKEKPEKHGNSSVSRVSKVGDEGLETIDVTRWVNNNFGPCGFAGAAESGAVVDLSASASNSLDAVSKAWTSLTLADRADILAIVRRRIRSAHQDGGKAE